MTKQELIEAALAELDRLDAAGMLTGPRAAQEVRASLERNLPDWHERPTCAGTWMNRHWYVVDVFGDPLCCDQRAPGVFDEGPYFGPIPDPPAKGGA